MKYLILLLFLTGSIGSNCQMHAVIKETGEAVELFDDGSWRYVYDDPSGSIKTDTVIFNKTKESNFLVQSNKLHYEVWFNKKKWSHQKSDEDGSVPAEYVFTLIGEDAYGLVISERIEVPIDNLMNIAVQNAQKAAPDIRVVTQECRRVNSKVVHFMQMEGTIQGIKFVYMGYYYSDSNGSLQFLTYTSQNLLKQYQEEMLALLNGLVIED